MGGGGKLDAKEESANGGKERDSRIIEKSRSESRSGSRSGLRSAGSAAVAVSGAAAGTGGPRPDSGARSGIRPGSRPQQSSSGVGREGREGRERGMRVGDRSISPISTVAEPRPAFGSPTPVPGSKGVDRQGGSAAVAAAGRERVGGGTEGRDESKESLTTNAAGASKMKAHGLDDPRLLHDADDPPLTPAAHTAREIARMLSATPQMRWENESASQDMATSIGESFWKRFKESQQGVSGDGTALPPSTGVQVDKLAQLLPPPSSSRFSEGIDYTSGGARSGADSSTSASANTSTSTSSEYGGAARSRGAPMSDRVASEVKVEALGYSPSHIVSERATRSPLGSVRRQQSAAKVSLSDSDEEAQEMRRRRAGPHGVGSDAVEDDAKGVARDYGRDEEKSKGDDEVACPLPVQSRRDGKSLAAPSAASSHSSSPSSSSAVRERGGGGRGVLMHGRGGLRRNGSDARLGVDPSDRADEGRQDSLGLEVLGQRHNRGDNREERVSSAASRQDRGSHTPSGVRSREGVRGGGGVRGGAAGGDDLDVDNSDLCSSALDRLINASSLSSGSVSQRLTNVKLLGRLWDRKNIDDVIDHLSTMHEGSRSDAAQLVVLGDFLSAVEFKGMALTLDSCMRLLALLERVFAGAEGWSLESVVVAVLKTLKSLLDAFGELIRQTRSIMIVGVDLSREERLRKCNACHTSLLRLRDQIDQLKHYHRKSVRVIEKVMGLQPLLERALG